MESFFTRIVCGQPPAENGELLGKTISHSHYYHNQSLIDQVNQQVRWDSSSNINHRETGAKNDNSSDDGEDGSLSTITKATGFWTSGVPTATNTCLLSRSSMNHHGRANGGLSGALAKLRLCSVSAQQEAMDLQWLVTRLRQAERPTDAMPVLRQIRDMLDASYKAESGTSSSNHPKKNSKRTKPSSNGSKASSPSEMMTQSSVQGMSPQELQQEFVFAGVDHSLVACLWQFENVPALQLVGIQTIAELCAHGNLPNQKALVQKGAVEVVLSAMKTHRAEEQIQQEGCHALKNIMKYYDPAKISVSRNRGVNRILEAMMAHQEYAGVQRQACYALTSLACVQELAKEIVEKEGHLVLLRSMQTHDDDPFVLAEAWRTLTNLVIHNQNVSLDEEIGATGNGVRHIFLGLSRFATTRGVPIQSRGLALLCHLCYRSRVNLELVTTTSHLEVLHQVLRIQRDNDRVQAAGEKLVGQISVDHDAIMSRIQRQEGGVDVIMNPI